jgi:hypothetical protein
MLKLFATILLYQLLETDKYSKWPEVQLMAESKYIYSRLLNN